MGWAVTDHVSPKDPSHPSQDVRNMKLVFSIAAQAETWGGALCGQSFIIILINAFV